MDTLIYSLEKGELCYQESGKPYPHKLHAVGTVGGYDGVHLGHRSVIRSVVQEAQHRGLHSAVFTFDPMPRKILRQSDRHLRIGTLQENLQQIAALGVDYCVILPFSRAFSELPAQDFLRKVLFTHCGVEMLLVGYDNRFGRSCGETFDDYQRYAHEIGMQMERLSPIWGDDSQNQEISSSLIRKQILSGNLSEANQLLGYPYSFAGKVVRGNQIGRTLDYPTANVELEDPDKILPPCGVYAAQAIIDSRTYNGMLYIGLRPTIDDQKKLVIEMHLFDFAQDLYEQHIRIVPLQYFRGEMLFGSLQELQERIAQDEEEIRQYWKQYSQKENL